jgi:hypothetical protein
MGRKSPTEQVQKNVVPLHYFRLYCYSFQEARKVGEPSHDHLNGFLQRKNSSSSSL